MRQARHAFFPAVADTGGEREWWRAQIEEAQDALDILTGSAQQELDDGSDAEILMAYDLIDAEALAKSAYAQGRWRVRRRLMLGMFDEAFECEDEEGREAPLVVEMRTGKSLPLAEAAERASAKRKGSAADPERARLCREAWAPFRKPNTGGAQR